MHVGALSGPPSFIGNAGLVQADRCREGGREGAVQGMR